MTQQRERVHEREGASVSHPVTLRDRPSWPLPTPPEVATPVHEQEPASWIRPGRTLLVASTGGHLEQLYRLRHRFQPMLEEVEWATFNTPQSRHLLRDETVHYVPFVKPRDAKGTFLDGVEAARLLGRHRYSRVISTGAAVAVPFLGFARRHGLAAHYIESAARSEGLSLSGQMVSRIPGVRLYGQYPGWTSGRWQFRGSVFDGFAPSDARPAGPVDKVVVSFGTQKDFGFRRGVEALSRLLPQITTASPTILWQTGATDTSGLAIDAVDSIPPADLEHAVAEADLVISHSGVGTALLALEHGKCPVLLPRRKDFAEHADDHQRLIAEELGRRGLAVWADPDDLTVQHLLAAAPLSAVGVATPPPFLLQPD
jgi:UDP-N-acetylglucosamine--N-acetylmuramyl-(pentapeptide) pyrophosphoryl-undecaprenol N-acetylglucosamine transferase